MISYVGIFTNGERTIRKEASFNIIVVDSDGGSVPDLGPVGPPYDPENPEDAPNWIWKIETDLIPDDPSIVDPEGDKPIPFIKSLSDEGLLTIGWDRLMSLPSINYAQIP